jgi:hypothetical protein
MFLGVFAKFFDDCQATLDLISKGEEIEKKKRKDSQRKKNNLTRMELAKKLKEALKGKAKASDSD